MALSSISLVLNFSLSFLVTPVIIRKLGPSGFGIWALLQSFSGYYGLVNLGMSGALQRFVSRDLAKKQPDSLQITVSTSLAFFCITGSLILLAASTLATPAASFFDITEAEKPTFALTLVLCATAVVTDFFNALMGTLLTARERFDLSSKLEIFAQLTKAGGILAILHFLPATSSLAFVICTVSVLILLLRWVVVARVYPEIRLTWRAARFARYRELVSYGSSTMLTSVANIARLKLGSLILAKTAGVTSVGIYSVASNLVTTMNTVIAGSLMNVLTPRLTRLHALNNQAELKQLFRLSIFSASVMACGMGLMLFVFGERFILLWVGDHFVESVSVLHVLTFVYVLSLSQGPSWNLMGAMNKLHFMSWVSFFEALVIVGLGFWLSGKYGAIGLAWATALPMVVTKALIHPWYTARIANMTLTEYLAPIALPFGLAAGVFGLCRLLHVNHALLSCSLPIFLGGALVCGLLFIGLVWMTSRHLPYAPKVNLSRFLASLRRPPKQV